MVKIKMVKISEIISKTYQPIKFKGKNTRIVDVGGRGCTKSSKNAILIGTLMSMYSNCDCVVVRNDFTQHRNTTYRELITGFQRLGLVEGVHFKTGLQPLEITFHTGNKIYFIQGKETEKVKGFTPTSKDNFIGIVWFFEISEFSSDEKIEENVSTFARGSNKKFFYEIFETNRPPNKFHWLHKWEKEQQKNPNAVYNFKTYLDLTEYERQNWLGEPFLNTIESLKNSNLDAYNHIYLGLPRNLENSVYQKQPLIKERPSKFDFILVGLDYGEVDATSVVCVGVHKDEYYIFEQYYRKNVNREKMTINDYVAEVTEFLNEIYLQENVPMDFYIETSPNAIYPLFEQNTILNMNIMIHKVKKKGVYSKDVIQERIDTTNFLIGQNRLFITDDKMPIVKAFATAEYKNGKRLDNGKYDIDSLDSFEYAIQTEIQRILKGVTSNDK